MEDFVDISHEIDGFLFAATGGDNLDNDAQIMAEGDDDELPDIGFDWGGQQQEAEDGVEALALDPVPNETPTASHLECKTCRYDWNPTVGWMCPVCLEKYIDIEEEPTTVCGNGHNVCRRCLSGLLHEHTNACPTCRLPLLKRKQLNVNFEMVHSLTNARKLMKDHVQRMRHTRHGTFCYLHAPPEALTLDTMHQAIDTLDQKLGICLSGRSGLDKQIKSLTTKRNIFDAQLKKTKKLRKKFIGGLPSMTGSRGRRRLLDHAVADQFSTWAKGDPTDDILTDVDHRTFSAVDQPATTSTVVKQPDASACPKHPRRKLNLSLSDHRERNQTVVVV